MRPADQIDEIARRVGRVLDAERGLHAAAVRAASDSWRTPAPSVSDNGCRDPDCVDPDCAGIDCDEPDHAADPIRDSRDRPVLADPGWNQDRRDPPP